MGAIEKRGETVKQKPIELDELTQRRHELARLLGEHRRTPGGTLTAEARRWLELEQGHYAKSTDNDLTTWAAARARIEAAYALADERTAARQAAQDEARAAAEVKAAEVEAAIRAKIAAEVDPVTQYKRAHAKRTF
jgi:hypothetical protein